MTEKVRHVNPEAVEKKPPSPLALSLFYDIISSGLAGKNFSLSKKLAEKALEIHGPGDIGFALKRFHKLLLDEVGQLNETRASIQVLKELVAQGRVKEALEQFNVATLSLAKANITYMDLSEAAAALQRRLGARTSRLLGAVRSLLGNYTLELLSMNLTAVNPGRLEATRLIMRPERTRCWVGSSLSVEGRLETASAAGLANRTVFIVLGGSLAGRAVTGSGGWFHASVTIPYRYVDTMRLYAFYIPRGEDLFRYAGSSSNVTELDILFVRPNISLAVSPKRVLPGGELLVEGRVSPGNLTLAVEGLEASVLVTADNGLFSCRLRVPESLPSGLYPVRVRSLPRGVVGPAENASSVEVYRLPVILASVETPRIMLASLPSRISGTVRGPEKPLGEFTAIASLGGELVYRGTGRDGEFSVNVIPPFYVQTGYVPVKLTVLPGDHVHQTASFQLGRVLVVNPYPFLAVAAAALAAYKLASRRMKPESTGAAEQAGAFETAGEEEEAGESGEAGGGDPVFGKYLEAVRSVERFTGLRLLPSMTLREYLGAVRGRLGEAAGVFAELTLLVERHLYGAAPVDAGRVASLSEAVVKALEAGMREG